MLSRKYFLRIPILKKKEKKKCKIPNTKTQISQISSNMVINAHKICVCQF